MRKAIQTMGLMLFIAVVMLFAVTFAFTGASRQPDTNPNDILARTLMLQLRDGQTFALADAYPDAWDTVQVMQSGETLTAWEWRTLRAFDEGLVQLGEREQLLIFWCDGEIARAVRLAQDIRGMPRFAVTGDAEQHAILSREKAVFRATLVSQGDTLYYACVPQAALAII